MSIESENNFKKSEKPPEKISEVAPIRESRNTMVRTREQLRELVEGPLLSACEEFYDKNIRTLSASANKQDIKYGAAHIVIDFDSLSKENKEIGKQIGEVYWADNINQLDIKISISADSTFEEIKAFAESIAHKFTKQEMTWAPSYTLEQVRKIYGIDSNDESYGIEAFADQFYYDKDKKLFYMSEEHARKARETIEKSG